MNSFPQDSNYAFDHHYVRVLSKTKQRQEKGEMEVYLKNLLQRWEIVFILVVSVRAEKKRKVFRVGTLR